MALQQQGSSSKIDYDADFHTYLKYLITGLTANKSSVKEIFRIWNAYFFPSESSVLQVTPGIVPARAVEEAFEALYTDDLLDAHPAEAVPAGAHSITIQVIASESESEPEHTTSVVAVVRAGHTQVTASSQVAVGRVTRRKIIAPPVAEQSEVPGRAARGKGAASGKGRKK